MEKLPDMEARKRLAMLVGLKELPELDQTAIYRLDGLMKNQLQKHKSFDSVEQVRTVRGD
jgi:biotin synthase-like enzyme